ncbi:MAG: thioredoxin family protein [Chitinophagales bacterium]
MKRVFIFLTVFVLCSSFTIENDGTPKNTTEVETITVNESPTTDTNQSAIYKRYLHQITEKPEIINWLSWKEAMELQKEQPKKIMVDLYTEWCVWCERMEKSTFNHPMIAKYINENFYPVKFDAETRETINFRGRDFNYEHQVERGYNMFSVYLTRGQLSYPSVVFLDEGINNPQPIKGFQNPVVMDKLLHFFGENYYLKYDWAMFNQYYISPLQKQWINRQGKKMSKQKKY